ncbi:hypothetical protein [Oceanobacillus profundus]|uniref:hypothetical protein n=1 Tax=Oceanobacillus TaxID=182709 RepID=UPI0026E2E169|nr:hypothetical protein [Oceanobacillus profundus]MDO6448839.1 hypothetical protein [Oceanobacillus profundus]
MKRGTKIFYYNVALLMLVLLLVGCSDSAREEADAGTNEDALASEPVKETEEPKENNQVEENSKNGEPSAESEETIRNDSIETPSEETKNEESTIATGNEEENSLSTYSSEEIEYARVWLQLGPNQEIDELNVLHIPAGEPLNPDDNTDVKYPEDVIQLSGSRLVDGSVTYSGNGDGTINIYNVPLRWYGGFSPPDDLDKNDVIAEMENIIENTELVYIEPGMDEEVIDLIELLNIH